MEKREPSHTVGGNVSWCSHYGKQYGGSSEKLKIELPYDPAIPLLGIYPDKTVIQKDTCTPMFIAALFTIPGHGSNLNVIGGMDKEDVVHIYNAILLSHKKE